MDSKVSPSIRFHYRDVPPVHSASSVNAYKPVRTNCYESDGSDDYIDQGDLNERTWTEPTRKLSLATDNLTRINGRSDKTIDRNSNADALLKIFGENKNNISRMYDLLKNKVSNTDANSSDDASNGLDHKHIDINEYRPDVTSGKGLLNSNKLSENYFSMARESGLMETTISETAKTSDPAEEFTNSYNRKTDSRHLGKLRDLLKDRNEVTILQNLPGGKTRAITLKNDSKYKSDTDAILVIIKGERTRILADREIADKDPSLFISLSGLELSKDDIFVSSPLLDSSLTEKPIKKRNSRLNKNNRKFEVISHAENRRGSGNDSLIGAASSLTRSVVPLFDWNQRSGPVRSNIKRNWPEDDVDSSSDSESRNLPATGLGHEDSISDKPKSETTSPRRFKIRPHTNHIRCHADSSRAVGSDSASGQTFELLDPNPLVTVTRRAPRRRQPLTEVDATFTLTPINVQGDLNSKPIGGLNDTSHPQSKPLNGNNVDGDRIGLKVSNPPMVDTKRGDVIYAAGTIDYLNSMSGILALYDQSLDSHNDEEIGDGDGEEVVEQNDEINEVDGDEESGDVVGEEDVEQNEEINKVDENKEIGDVDGNEDVEESEEDDEDEEDDVSEDADPTSTLPLIADEFQSLKKQLESVENEQDV